jgi:hypothetical protein
MEELNCASSRQKYGGCDAEKDLMDKSEKCQQV